MYPLLILVIAIGGMFAAGGGLDMLISDPFTKYDNLFHTYSSMYSVPWRWLKAIAMNESNLGRAPSVAAGILNPSDVTQSVSSDGKSYGLTARNYSDSSAV